MAAVARLLVVDDEIAHRRFVNAVLSGEGWIVDEADSGDAALRAVGRESFDLMLLDIQMPGLDGFATAQAIRQGGGNAADLPILAFTSMRGDAIRERVRSSGMDGHLAKPCSPDHLVATARSWLPDGGAAVRDRLAAVFGAAEFDSLLDGLADQLRDAVSRLDQEDGAAGRAHRIGGLAGTLGFKEVSDAWIALSEGDQSAREMARSSARKALLDIAARRLSARSIRH